MLTPEMGSQDTENAPVDAAEGNSYTLPPDAVPEGTKEGDTITFHVESVDEDGTVRASCDHGDDTESVNWRDELRKNVPKEGM